MAINTSSRSKAFAAFRQDKIPESMKKPLTNKQLRLVLKAFNKQHPAMAGSMCTAKGAELIKIDGRITPDVIDHFTSKHVPVLTIHDSYIISDKHSAELRTIINGVLINAPF
tara:strand:+ start:863 stop:1198 length:336 start_codon:yes stop_codon:yes gene_type:complete